jgi:hypothetical protein
VRVISGAEVTAPATTGDKPSAPSDALIVVEILLVNSTTAITTAMLTGTDDLARRQDFVWTTANKIGVTAGSWSNITSTVLNVQTALDSVDTELISRNASGEVDAALLPNDSVATGSASKRWTTVFGKTLNVSTGIVAASNGLPAGDATNRFEVFTNTAKIYTAITANANGLPIGDATNRFDAHLEDAIIYSTLKASADGKVIGDATNRFVHHVNSITNYGALAGTHVFSAAKSVTVLVPVDRFVSLGGTDWAWNSTRVYLVTSVSTKVMRIFFRTLHGTTITSMRINWSQASGTGMSCILQKLNDENGPATVGSSKQITTIDGSVNWDTIDTYTETVDLSTSHYAVEVTSADNVAQHVYTLEMTYTVTDINKAALA